MPTCPVKREQEPCSRFFFLKTGRCEAGLRPGAARAAQAGEAAGEEAFGALLRFQGENKAAEAPGGGVGGRRAFMCGNNPEKRLQREGWAHRGGSEDTIPAFKGRASSESCPPFP